MSIIFLGDCHIGARNANIAVMEHQLSYFEKTLFPYLKKHNIETILQLGDLFDTRKFSNHLILYNWKKRFFDYMEKEGITFITLLGNHDIHFKNTVEVNSTSIFLAGYSNIQIIDTPVSKDIEGVQFLLVPWICQNNAEQVSNEIKNTTSLYCAGHFEFAGFEMNPGQLMTDGDSVNDFQKFDAVFSGHYHTRSKKGNVEYIGIPYELTWIDYNDPKGFTVFDTKTHTHKFVKNDKSLFVKIHYSDKDKGADYWKSVDVSVAVDSYVKVIVGSKTDPYQFSKFIDKIVALSPVELKIIDEVDDFTDVAFEDEEVKSEDTSTLIDNFVKQADTDLDKTKISSILKSLYVEALHQ